MLIDANLLLYAVDESSPFHVQARDWLVDVLNGPRRVGLPWQSLVAFIRISTHESASARPLSPGDAMRFVDDWLAADVAWVPAPGARHHEILGGLVRRHHLRGNLVSDGHLAALAIEHGLQMCSADTDFARFDELDWLNPIAPS